jgi:hypothetical protein
MAIASWESRIAEHPLQLSELSDRQEVEVLSFIRAIGFDYSFYLA